MKKTLHSDLERLKKMKDSDIDFSDCPEFDEEFLKNAKIILPQRKEAHLCKKKPRPFRS